MLKEGNKIYLFFHPLFHHTDILYNKLIVNKIDTLSHDELYKLSTLFNEVSDTDIFLILTNKINPNNKYTNLFKKLKE